jgi:amino acid transporter
LIKHKTSLKRSLSLPLLTFYGLGNILGAGIYVLVGKVVAVAGMYAPVSFLLASLLAAFSAISYAELSARYPLSAGESIYLHEAFGIRALSLGVGLLIVLAGVLSSAAIVQGFVGYVKVFYPATRELTIIIVVSALCALAIWGIVESVRAAVLLTLLELLGLLLILWTGRADLVTVTARWPELWPESSSIAWYGIFWGGLLAFYAYIGFEDMVNVAEEVKNPQKTLPQAILIALVVSALLYFLIALVAVLGAPADELAASDAPLALIYQHYTGKEPLLISAIGLFAVINGALVQIIMVSRILYGLSRKGWLPALFGAVHLRTRTPIISTLLASLAVMLLALSFDISSLAENTSFVILIVFVLINAALISIKQRNPAPDGIKVYPVFIPVMGLLTAMGFVIFKLIKTYIA